MSPLPTPRHALIIGGGIAGPSLALCLAKINISSTIYEIRPGPSTAGGSISLGPNALHVLDQYCGSGLYARIRQEGHTYWKFGAYLDGGEKLGEIQVGEEENKRGKRKELTGAQAGDSVALDEKGYPSVRIMRSSLQKVLLDACASRGDQIEVKFGAVLDKVEEGGSGVTAFFQDGTTAKGDLMFGADGLHSKVREHILGPESPTPKFDGICIVYGFLPTSSAVLPSLAFTFPAFMFNPSGVFMTIPIDPEGKTLAWVINRPVKERASREEWKALEESGEAAKLAKAEYRDIQAQPTRSLLDNADEKQAKIWPVYSIPELQKWHSSRVCLIGDAAHGLPPHGAQGAALAFEDAAILTRLLSASRSDEPVPSTSLPKVKSYDDLFTRFEGLRRPRIAKIQATTSGRGGAFSAKAGPVMWMIKKLVFRVFFWWKNGVLSHTEETAYNVDEADLGI